MHALARRMELASRTVEVEPTTEEGDEEDSDNGAPEGTVAASDSGTTDHDSCDDGEHGAEVVARLSGESPDGVQGSASPAAMPPCRRG